jgi:ribosomal protein S18 acetylase RimI-like enzyme
MPLHISQARTEVDLREARRLFADYAESLGIDLEFQGFSAELASLPGEYVPPLGALLLARNAPDRALGCVALRPLEPPLMGEIKRLYVAPDGRGQGLGAALTQRVIAAAAEAGYERVRLDTLPCMKVAQTMYERLGFRDIEPYRYNPVEGARYLELVLERR